MTLYMWRPSWLFAFMKEKLCQVHHTQKTNMNRNGKLFIKSDELSKINYIIFKDLNFM